MIALLLACGLEAPSPPPVEPLAVQRSGCPVVGAWKPVGRLADPELDEVSGIVASQTHAGVFWVHEDSGADPVLHALGPDGSDRGQVRLTGVGAVDWEDLARVSGDGRDRLLIADLGDNRERRTDTTVIAVDEPRPGLDVRLPAQPMRIRYPDGSHNVETLLAMPDGSLFVVTKQKDGESTLFALGAFHPGEVVAQEVGRHIFAGEDKDERKVTGGDIDPSGRWLALRTYAAIWLFPIPDGDLGRAYQGAPCRVVPPREEQGESIAFAGDRLVIVSEGTGAPIYEAPFRPPGS